MQTFDAFAIGDTVYVPRVFRKDVPAEQCPDCLGTGLWHISTPGGISRDITCPRCRGEKNSNWIWPKRYVHTIEINEGTVTEVSITVAKREDVTTTNVSYRTSPYIGHIYNRLAFATREEAHAAAEAMMESQVSEHEKDYAKERQRQMERAGQDIVTALTESANAKLKDLQSRIEKLKDKMTDAIRHPIIYGPKIRTTGYSHEITSQAMADWLSEILQEADIEGWSENELLEAMCSC